jgi:hypothetical protein
MHPLIGLTSPENGLGAGRLDKAASCSVAFSRVQSSSAKADVWHDEIARRLAELTAVNAAYLKARYGYIKASAAQ